MPVNEFGYSYSIKLIIQLVNLVQLDDAVGILFGGDCKFYITVSLQLCKFTDDQVDVHCED